MSSLVRTVSDADIAAVRLLAKNNQAKFEELKVAIKSTNPDELFTKAPKSGYICTCGNGEGKDGTGIDVKLDGQTYLYDCKKCPRDGDLIDLIAFDNNLDRDSNFFKVLAIGANIIGFSLNDSTPTQKNQTARSVQAVQDTTKATATDEKELAVIHDDISTAQKNLPKFFEMQGGNFRGLTPATAIYYGCGFLPQWISPKTRREFERGERDKLPPPSQRFIVSTANHYNAVMLPNDRPNVDKKLWKMHAGHIEVFGADFLPENVEMIIITEGEIDAMSIWQATDGKFIAIATCGAANKKVVQVLQAKFPTHKPKILILFDYDDGGKINAPKLRESLLNVGFPAVYKFLSEESKIDANDILINEGDEALAKIISSIVDSAQNDFADAEEEIAKVENFNNRAQAWEKFHGIIDPAILEELRQAEKYFNSLTAENITAKIILDSKRKIALCKVHDFCELSATEFIAKIENAIQTADNKVKTARKDNGTVDADTEVLANVSIRAFKENIEKQVSQVRKERKNFLQNHIAKISKQKHDKFLAEQQLLKQRRAAEIEKLLQAPLTDEVKAKIIANITENLEWATDKFGERVKVKATAMNFKEIFCNDPNIKDLVAYDEFQQSIVFAKKPPWKKDSSCISEPWQDSDDSEMRIYLRETYKELANETLTLDYITSYANKKSFHVVKDYFNGLPAWDKVKRAEEIFIKFLRIDDTPYTREITLKFLLAAMARIYHPGCSFQSALVLQGAQSIGKSFVIERLGGKFHTTLSDNVDDSHAIDALQNSWIVEIKEMSAARKAELNSMKSFIERPADNRRAAYARRAQISKRHCVFAITVNDESFLRDQTGNRRFWILKCKSKMFEIVEGLDDDYISQIWAEIKAIYTELFAEGFDDTKLQLSIETKRRAEEVADEFMQDDGMKGEIEAFLDTKIPHKVIWQLLTKEQRRKFFETNSITIQESTLRALHNSNHFSSDTEFEDVLYQADYKKNGGYRFTKGDSKDAPGFYTFFGVELRQSICAAEILNECFANSDRRKSSQKITELLNKIEGWQFGGRNKKYPCYGDQKKIYYRVNEEVGNEEVQISEQPNSAEEVEEDFPF